MTTTAERRPEPAAEPEPLRLRQSDTVAEIAKALAAAQGLVSAAEKDSKNPHYNSVYADLASVWRACREALSSNGLSVVQSPSYGRQAVHITTRLLHSSGEWFEGTLAIPVGKADAHGIGSAVTYGRRYSLAAMIGVAPDDDDGNAAAEARRKSNERSRQRPQSRDRPPDAREVAMRAAASVGGKLTPASELPPRDDVVPWETWLTPKPEVLASAEPHPWYCAALKGLLAHIGADTAGTARKVLSWAMGEHVANPAAFKGNAALAKSAWERLIEADATLGVPFDSMLAEAEASAAESATPAGPATQRQLVDTSGYPGT